MTDSSDTNSAEYQEAEIINRDQYVHENCDESLFRPVVTLFSRGDIDGKTQNSDILENIEQPIGMGSELIVPVMEEKILPKKFEEEIVIKTKSKNEKKIKSVKTVKEPVKPIKEPVKLVKEIIQFIEQDDLPIQPVLSDISQEPYRSVITVNEPVIDEITLTKKLKEASKKIKEKTPEPIVIDEIILNKKSIKKNKPILNDSDFDEPIRKLKEKSPAIEEPIKKIKKTKETFEESVIKIEEPIIKEPEVSVTLKLKKKSQQKEEIKPKVKERTKLLKKFDDDFVTVPRLEKKDFAIIDIEDDDEIQPIKSFSEMFKASEHFTIQDNLTKNSDFILKTNKLEKRRDSDFTLIEPEDEPVKQKLIKSKEQEQFFDTSASKFDLDFTENLFSNPLPPLESFVDSLDQLNFQEDSELMNFEEKEEIEVKTKIMKYDETNLIFADCTSLHGEDFGEMDLAIGGRDNNSSDDTEDSNSSNEKKLCEDEDEIGTAAADACNVKNILETLPDNNQKDIKQQSTNANNNNKKKTKKKKR